MIFDTAIFNFINGFSNKWWPLDWLGVFLADYLGYFLVVIAILFLIKGKGRRQQVYFFSLATLSVILSRGLITELIRFFYDRPRPFLVLEIQPLINHAAISSFPSGHAAAFFALALAIFYFFRQDLAEGAVPEGESRLRWGARLWRQNKSNPGWWFFIGAVLMGLARVFVGVHWPTDIIAGAIIGLISAFAVNKLLFIFKPARSLSL